MSGDMEQKCGCVMGVRYICVKHCGGHAIPEPKDLPIHEEHVLEDLMKVLTQTFRESTPTASEAEVACFRLGVLSLGKVFLVAAEELTEPEHG